MNIENTPTEHPPSKGTESVPQNNVDGVEISTDQSGKLWVNVDGRCVFRAGHAGSVTFESKRVYPLDNVSFGEPADADGELPERGDASDEQGSAK